MQKRLKPIRALLASVYLVYQVFGAEIAVNDEYADSLIDKMHCFSIISA